MPGDIEKRIFLAHASEDKAQVRTLYAQLRAEGFAPWLDEEDLLPGQNWRVVIPNAIRDAAIFVACLSSRSVGKQGYVHTEFRTALAAYGERPPERIYIIPVKLDACEIPNLQIPNQGLSLRDLHWVELAEDRGFERLLRGLRDALGVTESPEEDRVPQPPEIEAERPDGPKAPEQPAPAPPHPIEPDIRQSKDSGIQDLSVFRDRDEPWCPEMVALPKGSFLMGSPDGVGDGDERPQHYVQIGYRLAVGRYPVTFEEYDRFGAATGAPPPKDEGWGRGRRPVINVSWQDAQAYVRWLGEMTGQPYRLLSEAEWEYAARAGTTTRYVFGEDISAEQANFHFDVRQTTEVASYPANARGLHDMHGNVWEWVEDCWNDSYQGAPVNGSAWTTGDCSRRVLRGGSWYVGPEYLRSADRIRNNPDNRGSVVGFRVARTLTP